MKFFISQEKLTNYLSIITRAVAQKPHLPILSNVLIEVRKGILKLQATNLEIGITLEEEVKSQKDGKVAIPARVFSDFIASLPPGEILAEEKDGSFYLNLQKFNARISTGNAEEFPVVPTSSQKADLVFEKEEFARAVSKVIFAAAAEEGRPVLTGTLFDLDKNGLKMVATDGYRLSFYKLGLSSKLNFKIIIPAKSLAEVLKIATETTDKKGKIEVILAKDQNQIIFKVANAEIVSRLIEGEFPDWEKIIPKEFPTRVVMNREEFLKAIRITSIFARDASNIIKCQIGEKSIILSANTKEVGDNVSEIDGRIDGEGGEIAFNYRYLLDVLSAINSEGVSFEMIGPLNPGRFKAAKENAEDFFHIVMPVRVQG